MTLSAFRNDRILLAWAALSAFTLLSFAFGEGFAPETVAGVAVLAIAYIKVNVIGWTFMELHGAPKPLQIGFTGFTSITGTVLIILYLAA